MMPAVLVVFLVCVVAQTHPVELNTVMRQPRSTPALNPETTTHNQSETTPPPQPVVISAQKTPKQSEKTAQTEPIQLTGGPPSLFPGLTYLHPGLPSFHPGLPSLSPGLSSSASSLLGHGNVFNSLYALRLNQMLLASLLGPPVAHMTPTWTQVQIPQGQQQSVIEGKQTKGSAMKRNMESALQTDKSSTKNKKESLRSMLASVFAERLVENSFGAEADTHGLAFNPLMSSLLAGYLTRNMDVQGLCMRNGGTCMETMECRGEAGFQCGPNSVCCREETRLSFRFNSGNFYSNLGHSSGGSDGNVNAVRHRKSHSRRRQRASKKQRSTKRAGSKQTAGKAWDKKKGKSGKKRTKTGGRRKGEQTSDRKAVVNGNKDAKNVNNEDKEEATEKEATHEATHEGSESDTKMRVTFAKGENSREVSVEKDSNGGIYVSNSAKRGASGFTGMLYLGGRPSFGDWDFTYKRKK